MDVGNNAQTSKAVRVAGRNPQRLGGRRIQRTERLIFISLQPEQQSSSDSLICSSPPEIRLESRSSPTIFIQVRILDGQHRRMTLHRPVGDVSRLKDSNPLHRPASGRCVPLVSASGRLEGLGQLGGLECRVLRIEAEPDGWR